MSSTPTKEATQAAFKVKHGALNGNRYAYEFNLELAAEIIDRELKYPALLDSHRQLAIALGRALLSFGPDDELCMECGGKIGEINDSCESCFVISDGIKALAKAKEITDGNR